MQTRRTRLVLLGCLMQLTAMPQRPVVMPPPLKAGDTIAVLSPSSTPEAETVERGCAVLRQWGYVPVVGANALSRFHGFAGTPAQRADDLRRALEDATVRAIICSRGGDGAVQVLQRIPLDVFARHPKWIIGFSDATALHSAQVSAGVMSIHGSMCDGIAAEGRDSVNALMQQLLRGQLPTYHADPHPLNQHGEATGRLVGGNLSVFCGLAGSDYDFLNRADDEGLILFIEDTQESMTKVDRLLHQIEIRGILPRLRGIIVGHFSRYKSPENGFADMYDMLHEYLQYYDIPVCYDFPVGHHSGLNLPMVEGCPVRLRVDNSGTQIDFKPEQQ